MRGLGLRGGAARPRGDVGALCGCVAGARARGDDAPARGDDGPARGDDGPARVRGDDGPVVVLGMAMWGGERCVPRGGRVSAGPRAPRGMRATRGMRICRRG